MQTPLLVYPKTENHLAVRHQSLTGSDNHRIYFTLQKQQIQQIYILSTVLCKNLEPHLFLVASLCCVSIYCVYT